MASFPGHVQSRSLQLTASPTVACMDEAVDIQVFGLDPGQKVTMATKLIEEGSTFVAHAHYVADDNGHLDLSHSSSMGGTFTGKWLVTCTYV